MSNYDVLVQTISSGMSQFRIADALDILVIAVLIYHLLILTRETRAYQVLKGVGLLFIAALISDIFQIATLGWILNSVLTSGILVIVVLFQPEIRRTLEHLGRGTASCMDQFIVVVEPGARSIQTYENVKRLAAAIGVTTVSVVGNKVRSEDDKRYIESKIPAEAILGYISYSSEVIDADRSGLSPYDVSPAAVEEIRQIKSKMDANV